MAYLLRHFDIFGKGFTPTVSYEKVPKTIFGGVFGLFYFIFGVGLCYEFGKVLILKDSPTVLNTIDVDGENRINLTLPIGTNVTIRPKLFYTERTKEQWDKDQKYLTENLNKFFSIKFSYTTPSQRVSIPTKPCNSSDFITDVANVTDSDLIYLRNATCLDYNNINISLTKKFGDPRVEAIEVSYYLCENYTGFNTCMSKSDQDYFIKYFDFRVFYSFPGLMFIPAVYKNPFSRYSDFFYSKVITNPVIIPVTHYIEVANVYLTTDIGLISEYMVFDTWQKLDSSNVLVGGPEYEQNSVDKIFRRKLNELVIYTSKNNYIIQRSYPRAQDVLANITGVTCIATIILAKFLGNIYRSKTREMIIHQVFNLDEETIMREIREEKEREENFLKQQTRLKEEAKQLQIVNKGVLVEEGIKVVEDNGNSERTGEKSMIANKSKNSLTENAANCSNALSNTNDVFNSKLCSSKLSEHPLAGSENILKQIELTEKGNNNIKSNPSNQSPVFNVANKHQLFSKFAYKNELHNSDVSLSKQDMINFRLKKIPTKFVNKENFTFKNENHLLLSMSDHFLLTYFHPCICGRSKKIYNYYTGLQKYVKDYTDILTFSNSVFELEKLKYILFDEDQAALFNFRSKIQVGKKEEEQNDFTKFYYFLKDLNDDINLKKISEGLVKRENQRSLNKN